jgi:hypothetical protein
VSASILIISTGFGADALLREDISIQRDPMWIGDREMRKAKAMFAAIEVDHLRRKLRKRRIMRGYFAI